MKKRSLALLLGGALALAIVIAAILVLRNVIPPAPHIQCEAIRPLITYNGIFYTPSMEIENTHRLTEADLGPVVGTAGTRPHNVEYDCGLLNPGQNVYSINGYRDTFRLAVREQNGISFFEVADNPHARTGADLFDINGRVQFITVSSLDNPGSTIKTIRDPQSVQALTRIILEAPIAKQCSYGNDEEALLFHLKDENVVEMSYWPTEQELGTRWPQCVKLPLSFAARLAASQ